MPYPNAARSPLWRTAGTICSIQKYWSAKVVVPVRAISAQETSTAGGTMSGVITSSTTRTVLYQPSKSKSECPSASPRNSTMGVWVWALTSPGISSRWPRSISWSKWPGGRVGERWDKRPFSTPTYPGCKIVSASSRQTTCAALSKVVVIKTPGKWDADEHGRTRIRQHQLCFGSMLEQLGEVGKEKRPFSPHQPLLLSTRNKQLGADFDDVGVGDVVGGNEVVK